MFNFLIIEIKNRPTMLQQQFFSIVLGRREYNMKIFIILKQNKNRKKINPYLHLALFMFFYSFCLLGTFYRFA